jgi:hypothetical protein
MNYRPQYSGFYNDGPVDPGSNINFQSTSTDPDTVGGEDDLYIVVCSSNANYSSSTNTCTDFIASSTISGVLQHASVTHNINNPTRDQQYAAYGYIYDEHGHTATGSPIYVPFTVNNVAPIVTSGNILLSGSTTNDGVDLTLSEPATETPSSSLRFTITDANSCQNASAGPEITNFEVSVFRSGVGTSSCAVAGDYDPNSCYTSTIGTTTTWKLDCTASSTCAGPSQDYMTYNCTFPLWFVADPTDAQPGNPYSAQNWSAGVAGIDDNYATGTMSTTSNPKQLISYSAIDILAADIVYGSLEPGNDTVTLPATSTILNVGNTGLDEELTGESMCDTFSVSSLCPGSATSTIDADQQRFGLASTTAFLAGTQLSSTSQTALDLNVATTTATSSPTEGTTYWGIAVPGTITYAGSYTGLNTFIAVTSDDNW